MAQVIYRKDYLPFPFKVERCRLYFEIFSDYVLVNSQIHFVRNPQYSTAKEIHENGILAENCILDGVGLKIIYLELDGRPLNEHEDYQYQEGKLELFNSMGKAHFDFAAKVQIDPFHNKALEGLYRSGNILCSQNEATGFRHITFYPDRPDVMAHFITEIEADKTQYPYLLSNGNLLESRNIAAGRHYVRWEDPFAKPAYLYALVAGDFDLLQDHFYTHSGRPVTLEIYTDKGKTALALHAMKSLKQAMKWDEQRFGREYDLDLYMIVAVDSFNFGAMENKGLNIFNSSLVFATDATATDATYESIATTIAHEYFHNWTGNRITCRDWFQLTLKEGLTVYRDELFSEDHFGREVCRIQQIRNLRDNQYPEDNGPNRHPIRPDSFIDINNFYTQTVYEKGAAVIRMMASYLGSETFRKGMDCYFARFDGQAVTCDDFVDALQEGSEKDLGLFRGWYEQAGTPQVHVRSEWDGRQFLLHIYQENPHAAVSGPIEKIEKTGESPKFPPLAFPLPFALYHPVSGHQLKTEMVLIKERETTLRYEFLEPLAAKPVPSLLLDHISPVEIHYNYSSEELLLLLCADRDSFNRYEAMQKYLQNLLLTSVPNEPPNEPNRPNEAENQDIILADPYVQQLAIWLRESVLDNPPISPRYLSELLQIPSVQVLSAKQSPPQFALLQQRREAYCRELAKRLETEMLSCYQALSQPCYERSKLAVGKRALRNTLLYYLCHLNPMESLEHVESQYHELAYRQYQNSDNMTDTFAALKALTYYPGKHSQAVLQNFSQIWQGDFLVLCRWFGLQASAPSRETLQNVLQLEQHPLFQKENPNMLRALYSMLGRNLPVFHDSGINKGYPAYIFLAERILQIDQFNSMMAAGLAKCFVAYKRLDAPAQKAMGLALNLILQNRTGISDRLYEIISKTLKQ